MSPYGEKLYEEYLNKIDMSQRQLAGESDIDPSVINHMIAGDSVGYGQGKTCAERQYKILRALSSHMPLYADKVRTLLQHIPKNNLTDTEREDLLTSLINEGIVKPVYFTRWQRMHLIGRDQAIQDIKSKLQEVTEDGTRFLTLVGVPGVGKSELAWQVREQMRLYGDFFTLDPISLDGVTRAEEVERRIMNALDRRDRQQITLLVLNDCEQIADNTIALEIINHFIENDPLLTILATSRVLLPSKSYPVDPLNTTDAIQLFCESARRIDENFRLTKENSSYVTAWCISLEGLPLALLIVGSWVNKLNDEKLHNLLLELSTPFPTERKRDTTLNDLIQVSYELLEKPEQTLLRRLGVFDEKCHLEAVAQVCSLSGDLPTDADSPDLVRWLNKLSIHHLITFTNEFVCIAHSIIREYAKQKLAQAKETEEISHQYIKYYDTLVTEYMILKYRQAENEEFPTEALASYLDLLRGAENEEFPTEALASYLDLLQGEEYHLVNAYIQIKLLAMRHIREKLTLFFDEQEFYEFSNVLLENLQNNNDEWTEELEKIVPFIQAIRFLRLWFAVPPYSWKIWDDFRRIQFQEYFDAIESMIWTEISSDLEDIKILFNLLVSHSIW